MQEGYFCTMRWIFLIGLMIYGFCAAGQEQTDSIDYGDNAIPYRAYFVEGALSIFSPQGNFNRQVEEVPIGFSLSVLYQMTPNKPFFLGVETYYACIDNLSNSWFGTFDNGDPADFDGTITSNIMGLNGIYRYYLPLSYGRIEPYIEGALGFKWLFAYESTTSFFNGFEESNDGEFISSDISLTYGGAVGIQVPAGTTSYINFKTSFLPGNSAAVEVRQPGVVPATNPSSAFESVQTATDVIKFDLGLTFVF